MDCQAGSSGPCQACRVARVAPWPQGDSARGGVPARRARQRGAEDGCAAATDPARWSTVAVARPGHRARGRASRSGLRLKARRTATRSDEHDSPGACGRRAARGRERRSGRAWRGKVLCWSKLDVVAEQEPRVELVVGVSVVLHPRRAVRQTLMRELSVYSLIVAAHAGGEGGHAADELQLDESGIGAGLAGRASEAAPDREARGEREARWEKEDLVETSSNARSALNLPSPGPRSMAKEGRRPKGRCSVSAGQRSFSAVQRPTTEPPVFVPPERVNQCP